MKNEFELLASNPNYKTIEPPDLEDILPTGTRPSLTDTVSLVIDDKEKTNKIYKIVQYVGDCRSKIFTFFAKKYKQFLMLFLIILGVKLYSHTLQKCQSEDDDNTNAVCIDNIGPQLYKWFFMLWLSSIIFNLSLILTYYHKLPKIFFIIVVGCLIYILQISNGWTYSSHGNYNLIIFTSFFFINIVTFIIVRKSIKVIKRHENPIIIILGLIVISVACGSIVLYTFKQSCQNWAYGFNDTEYQNQDNFCNVYHPNFCLYTKLNTIWDRFENFISSDSKPNANQRMATIMTEAYQFYGLPKTNLWSKFELSEENMMNNVASNIKTLNINNVTVPDPNNPELILKVSGLQAEILYNLYENQSIRDRVNQFEQQNLTALPLSKNVISIFLDTVSQPFFKHKFPNVFEWLQARYKPKWQKREQAFQFFNYQTVSNILSNNIISLYYGTALSTQPGESIFKAFQKQGFITGRSHDKCSPEHFSFKTNQYSQIDTKSIDYENSALFCFLDHLQAYNISELKEPFKSFIRQDLVLNYSKAFLTAYGSSTPKYLDIGFTGLDTYTSNDFQILDNSLYDFLEYLDKENWFDNTTLILTSGKGNQLNLFSYITNSHDDNVIQATLPIFYIVLPSDISYENMTALRSYENSIITPYDTYNVFQSLSGNNQYAWRGRDIYHNFIHKSTCESLYTENCLCHQLKKSQ